MSENRFPTVSPETLKAISQMINDTGNKRKILDAWIETIARENRQLLLLLTMMSKAIEMVSGKDSQDDFLFGAAVTYATIRAQFEADQTTI